MEDFMESSIKSEKTATAVKSENIIGTRWVGWSDFVCTRMSLEFVDKKNCVYTSIPRKFPMTYSLDEGRIHIKEINCSFEMRGRILYHNNYPAFVKAG